MLQGASEEHETGRTHFLSVIRVQKRRGLHRRRRKTQGVQQ